MDQDKTLEQGEGLDMECKDNGEAGERLKHTGRFGG
jgi:hypothetical protein